MFQFVESEFHIRSSAEHARYCNILERDDLASARPHFSTTFGINRRALLNSLVFFDVTSGALIPDIMHDVLEGALPLELKLMLKVVSMCVCSTACHNYIIIHRCS